MNTPHCPRPDHHVASVKLVLGMPAGSSARVSDHHRINSSCGYTRSELLNFSIELLGKDESARRDWEQEFICTRGDHRNHDCEVLNTLVYRELRNNYSCHLPDWTFAGAVSADSPYVIMMYRLSDQQLGPWNGDNEKWARIYRLRDMIAISADRGYRALLNIECQLPCLNDLSITPDMKCTRSTHVDCVCRQLWAQKNHCDVCRVAYRANYELAMNAVDYALVSPDKAMIAAIRSSCWIRQYFFSQPLDFGISGLLADKLGKALGLTRPDWAKGPQVQTQSFFTTIKDAIEDKFVAFIKKTDDWKSMKTVALTDYLKKGVGIIFNWLFGALSTGTSFLKGIWDSMCDWFMNSCFGSFAMTVIDWIKNNLKKFGLILALIAFCLWGVVSGSASKLLELPLIGYITERTIATVKTALGFAGKVLDPVKEKAVEGVACVYGIVCDVLGFKTKTPKPLIEHLWNMNRFIICLGTGYFVVSSVLYMLPVAFQELVVDLVGTPAARQKLAARRWMFAGQTLVKMGQSVDLFNNPDYRKKVKKITADGIRLIADGTMPRGTVLNINPWLSKLVRIEEQIAQSEAGLKPRPVPWVAHIGGPAGIFKSTFVRKIINELGYGLDQTFFKPNIGQYWEGAAAKPVVVLDEFLLGTPEQNAVTASEFVSMVSSNPFYPNFAGMDNMALGKKGDPFVGQAIITINNVLRFNMLGQDDDAVARRYSCRIGMEARKNYGEWKTTGDLAKGGNWVPGSNFLVPEPKRSDYPNDRHFAKAKMTWADDKAMAKAEEEDLQMVEFIVYGCMDNVGQKVVGAKAALALIKANHETFWKAVNPAHPPVAKPADMEIEYNRTLLESIGVYGSSWNPLHLIGKYLGKLIGTFTDAAETGSAAPAHTLWRKANTLELGPPPTQCAEYRYERFLRAPANGVVWRSKNWIYIQDERGVRAHPLDEHVEISKVFNAAEFPEGWYSQSQSPHVDLASSESSSSSSEDAETVYGNADDLWSCWCYCGQEFADDDIDCKNCDCGKPTPYMMSEICPKCAKQVLHRVGSKCPKCDYVFDSFSNERAWADILADLGLPDKDWSDEKHVEYCEQLAERIAESKLSFSRNSGKKELKEPDTPAVKYCEMPLARLKLFALTGRNFNFDEHLELCDTCRGGEIFDALVYYGSWLLLLVTGWWIGRKLLSKKVEMPVSTDASTLRAGKYARYERKYDPYGSATLARSDAAVSTDAGAIFKNYPAVIGGLSCIVVPIADNLFVSNVHSFGGVSDDTKRIPIKFLDPNFSNDAYIARSHLCLYLDKDVAVFRVTSKKMPGFKNVMSKLPTREELCQPGMSLSAVCEYASGFAVLPNTTFIGKDSMMPHGLNRVSKGAYEVTVDEMWISSCEGDVARPGDSGMPVVCTSPGPYSGKMLGIHSTSTKIEVGSQIIGMVACVPVWKEDVQAYLDKEKKTVSTDALIYEGPAAGVHCPRRSKIEKSPFYGELGVMPTKQPAILSPEDPRAAGKDPLSLAAKRYDVLNDALPDGMVLEMTANDFLRRIEPIFYGHVKRLTFEEAVKGLEGELSSVNMRTSPGYPLMMLSQGQGKKDWVWFENGELKYRPDFKRTVLMADAAYQRGELLIEPVMVAYLKDELVSQNKIDELRTRLTYATDLIFYLVFRMNHGTIMAAFNQSWKVAPWKSGMNPASYDMDYAVRPAMPKRYKYAFDFKNFDLSYNTHFQSYVYYFISKICKMTPSQFVAFKRHETAPKVVIGKELYQAIFNHCSGICVTTMANCFMSALLMEYVCVILIMRELEVGIREAIDIFVKEVYLCNLGDDVWYATNLDFLGPVQIKEEMAKIGLTITSDIKDQPLTNDQRDLEDLTFLGCQLRQVNGCWVGALKPEILYNTLQFTRDKCATLENQVKMMCEAASVHEFEFFNEYVSRINEVIIRKNLFDGRIIELDWQPTRELAASRMAGSEFDYAQNWTNADEVEKAESAGVNKILVPYTNEVEWPLAEWPLSTGLATIYDTQVRDNDVVLRSFFRWSDQNPAGTELFNEPLPGSITSAFKPSAANRINATSHKHRFSVLVEITLDGNRFNRGKLRVTYHPLGEFENFIGAGGKDDLTPRYLTNTFMRADHGQRAVLTIPWNFYYDFGLLDSLAEKKQVLGRLRVTVESPLAVPTGASNALVGSVYMALIDHQHAVVRTDASLIAGAAADVGISMLKKALNTVKNDSFESDQYGTMYVRNVTLTAIDGPRPYRALERNSNRRYDYYPLEVDTTFQRTSGSFALHGRKTLTNTLASNTLLWTDKLDCGVEPNLGQGPVYLQPTYVASAMSMLSRFGLEYEFELQKAYATTLNCRVTVSFFSSSNDGRNGNPAAYTVNHTFTEDKWRFKVAVPYQGLTEYLYPPMITELPMIELSSFGKISLHSVSGLNDVSGTGAELLVWKRIVDFSSLEINPAAILNYGNPAYIIMQNQPTGTKDRPKLAEKTTVIRKGAVRTDASEEMEGQLQEDETRESETVAVATDETQVVEGSPFDSNNARFPILITDWIHEARMIHNVSQAVEWYDGYSDLAGVQKNVLPKWSVRPLFAGTALFGAYSGDLNYIVTVNSPEPVTLCAIPICPIYQPLHSSDNLHYDDVPAEVFLYPGSTLFRTNAGTPLKGVVNTMSYLWNVTNDGIPAINTRAGSIFIPPIEEKFEYVAPNVQQCLVRVPWKNPLNYLPTLYDSENRIMPFAWVMSVRPTAFNAAINLKNKVEVRCSAGDNFRYHQPRCHSLPSNWVRVGTDVVYDQTFGNWRRTQDTDVKPFTATIKTI